MNRARLFIFLSLFILCFSPIGHAETIEDQSRPPDLFFRAVVLEIHEEQRDESVSEEQRISGIFEKNLQLLKVRITSGPDEGKEIEITHDITFIQSDAEKAQVGETIVVGKDQTLGDDAYYFVDKYRLPSLAILVAAFLALAVYFGRIRGLASLFGLAFSIFVLAKFVVPRILAGGDPFTTSLLGALAIATLSLYLAHGLRMRTHIAVASTLITLGITLILGEAAVHFGKLFGFGSEEAFYIQFAQIETVNLRGLLLGGIIIGVVGVLDDITTTQSAAVDEIAKANPSLPFHELYKRGLSVGREHISSLVNTLVMAYVGASMPLFLLFSVNNNQPAWLTINSEIIAEELVRTLVGSAALILAVPICTFIAAQIFSRRAKNKA